MLSAVRSERSVKASSDEQWEGFGWFAGIVISECFEVCAILQNAVLV